MLQLSPSHISVWQEYTLLENNVKEKKYYDSYSRFGTFIPGSLNYLAYD